MSKIGALIVGELIAARLLDTGSTGLLFETVIAPKASMGLEVVVGVVGTPTPDLAGDEILLITGNELYGLEAGVMLSPVEAWG